MKRLLLFSIIFYVGIKNGIKQDNIGYFIISFAAFIVIIASIIELYSLQNNNIQLAFTMATSSSNSAYILVIIGFLTLNLINEHKNLTNLALKDTLTDMNNRRGLHYMLETVIPNTIRYKQPLSVITIDIDFFKKINDTYGHDGGDIVLKQFAQLIKNSHRKSDISCRFGGEEFVLILPNTEKEGAMVIAEKLRIDTEKLNIQLDDKIINITACFGISTSSNENEIDIDALLKDADKALYVAKYSGRNMVCHNNDAPCRIA